MMMATASLLLIVCLLPFSIGKAVTPPPPPGPPRPIIPKAFTALLIVNSTTSTGSFNGWELFSTDAVHNRTVFNLTDFENKFRITQLHLPGSGKGYRVEWNQGVTDGVCTDIPAVDYTYPLWWVDDSSYFEYEEFFNWSIWGYTSTDKQTTASLVVTSDDPNRPLIAVFKNKTMSYTSIFVTFNPTALPDRDFDIPRPCSNMPRPHSPSQSPASSNGIVSPPSIGSLMQKSPNMVNDLERVGNHGDRMNLPISKEMMNTLARRVMNKI